MNITTYNALARWVTTVEAGGMVVRSMTLEQYAKHARDAAFAALIVPADDVAVRTALVAERVAAAAAAAALP